MNIDKISNNRYISGATPVNYNKPAENPDKPAKKDDSQEPTGNGLPPRESFEHLIHYYAENNERSITKFKGVLSQLRPPE